MPTHDLVTDFGGSGDGQRTSITASITSGASPVLTPAAGVGGPFASGDVGKAIFVVYSSTSYPTGNTPPTITAYNAGTGAITLSGTNSTSASSVTMNILWGTNNDTALTAWKAWAVVQVGQTILTIPSGRFVCSPNPFRMPNQGLPDVKWVGAGAGSTIISQLVPSEMRLGGDIPTYQKGLSSGGNSARIATAAAGASSVTLVDSATYGSKITVGRWCLIAGFDLQGAGSGNYGYPPNLMFYEWNKITGYSSGVVSLLNPLTQAYKSTWPEWTADDAFHADLGGPATIWVCDADFDSTVELNDLTLDSPYNQNAILCRDIILRRVTHTGPGTYPTQCNTFTADTCTYVQSLEMDKIVGTVSFTDCALDIVHIQSASPNTLNITGGTLTQLQGTPKRFILSGVAFSGAGGNDKRIQFGASTFGCTSYGTVTSCTDIATFARNSGGTNDVGTASSFYSFNAGVMRFLKSANDGSAKENVTRLLTPGAWVTFDDLYIDQVTDVYEDGTYCYIQWRTLTDWPFTPVSIMKPHPCPDFTMRSCTGTAVQLEDWNQAPARIPLYSYSKRTYTADGTGTTVKATPNVMGRLVTAKYTVTTPGSVTFNQSQFNNWTMYKSDYSTYSYGPTIACVNGGLRTVTGATTASGAQGADSIPDLTSVGQLWSPGSSNSGPVFSANGSNAVITVEINADQGIPAISSTQSAKVRLRVR